MRFEKTIGGFRTLVAYLLEQASSAELIELMDGSVLTHDEAVFIADELAPLAEVLDPEYEQQTV